MSNNGSQHLSALTRDDITAPHVNLVKSELPGDLYKYVGEHVWETLENKLQQLSKDDISQCERFIDTLMDLKKQIQASQPKSDLRKQLVSQIQSFKDKNSDIASKSAVVYWCRVKDLKHRRKVIKRNVMTLPYGGTAYGLG